MVGVEAPPEILHDHHLFSRQRRVFIDMIQLDGSVARQLFHNRLEIGDGIIAHQGRSIEQAHGDGIDERAFAPFPHEFVKGGGDRCQAGENESSPSPIAAPGKDTWTAGF